MTRRSINLIEFWLRICFYGVPLCAFAVAAYIRFLAGYFPMDHVDIRPYIVFTVIMTLLWSLIIERLKLSHLDTLLRMRTGVRMASLASSYCTVLGLAGAFFYRETLFARSFVAIGCALLFVFALVMMHVFRTVIRAACSVTRDKFHIAIVGADDIAGAVAQRLSANPLIPCQVACFVALPGQSATVSDAPVFQWRQLEDAIREFDCTELLLALPLQRFGEAKALLEELQRISIPARIVLELDSLHVSAEQVFNFYGVPLIDVRGYPGDRVAYALGKRIFDVVFSLAALIATSPVMLLIALAVKLTSWGPVFFVQDRVGLNGRVFRMYKFRTMSAGSARESDTQWTKEKDPRCTVVGSWLRRTSLDELPQFLNVLKGDMSIVGPRPERPHFVREFLEDVSRYNHRHYLKVGITGWAQVNGWRGDTSIHKRVEYDLYYLRNWSMTFDLKIILLTMFRGMIARNAY